jgi:hypothetical protein
VNIGVEVPAGVEEATMKSGVVDPELVPKDTRCTESVAQGVVDPIPTFSVAWITSVEVPDTAVPLSL